MFVSSNACTRGSALNKPSPVTLDIVDVNTGKASSRAGTIKCAHITSHHFILTIKRHIFVWHAHIERKREREREREREKERERERKHLSSEILIKSIS